MKEEIEFTDDQYEEMLNYGSVFAEQLVKTLITQIKGKGKLTPTAKKILKFVGEELSNGTMTITLRCRDV